MAKWNIRKEDKYCIDCGKKGVYERNRCKKHALIFNRKRMKKYGSHNYGKGICIICKKEMILWRKEQKRHLKCGISEAGDYNQYKRSKDGKYMIGRELFVKAGIKIPPKFHVHHIDGNPNNNTPNNLIAIPGNIHTQLHQYLQSRRMENMELSQFKWNIMKIKLTKSFLKIYNVKVIKLK